jgi:protocatechuate 3,4-dioxygenase beta subunit
VRVLIVLLLATALATPCVAGQIPPPPPVPRPNPQAMPPRDPVQRPEPVGTGVIRGRVVAADSGNPIRRATVNISVAPPAVPTTPPPGTAAGTPPRVVTQTVINGVPTTTSMPLAAIRNRTATTDAQGNFEFTGLPAGSYRLFANAGQYSAAYLASTYGAKRPPTPISQDSGTPIDLADGQKFEKALISLSRGAVITGRITDDNGEPMARVQVYTMYVPPGSTRAQRTGGNAQSDDLGHFRMFGLQSGEYIVAAEARGPTFAQPNAPPEREEDKIGFLTTYFPGTPDEGAAQRVRVRAGGETPGVEIRMVSGRLFTLSGIITDSQGRASARMSGSLMRTAGGNMSSFGFSTDEAGRFQMRNVPPGNYRLLVRGRPTGPDTGNDPGEMAALPLAVNSDLEGIIVTTSPGAAISGQVVFEQGPPQLAPGQASLQMRVNATPGDPMGMMGMPTPQPAVVAPDLSFQMKGFMPGEFLLRATGPNQVIKAVMVGAEDVTDTPREFKQGDRVTIVMTSRASIVEGNVTDEKGAPVTDAGILIFSDDKGSWRSNSVRTKRGGTDSNGHFRIMGLLPGRYYAIAAPRERMNISSMNQDAAYFEQLAKEATTLVVGEDETRQVDLKLVPMASGG